MPVNTKQKKGRSGRLQPKPDLPGDEQVNHRKETKLFPGRNDMMVTLMDVATATEISATKLRDWAKKGRIPGGVRPAARCRWEFQREKIEQWWARMLSGTFE
jgi:hypothetical protein